MDYLSFLLIKFCTSIQNILAYKQIENRLFPRSTESTRILNVKVKPLQGFLCRVYLMYYFKQDKCPVKIVLLRVQLQSSGGS